MMLEQTPKPGSRILLTTGTLLQVTLQTDPEQSGRAVLRTNIGRAAIRRHEIIAATEADTPPLARDWHDLTMTNAANGLYTIDLPLDEVGWFGAKACFIPEGSEIPQWPAGDNLAIKVSPATTACANTIYTAFVRQFGSALHHAPHTPRNAELAGPLLAQGYSVIPPSGTFRNLVQKLDTIMGHMRFNIIQLLPIHPTPTTFARMGLYGSPFAARDLLDVDPALAEFDTRATPLDQFRELVDAVHARQGRLFLDIPANHTGWASTLQIHHPEWFKQNPDGSFKSPGAWGVIWEDLVELDYSNRDLRAFMAEVFIFWCRQGVDGFRCDAGYMIPAETWTYIVARVRDAFPETTFMLEGLGGKIEVTDTLLANSNLDWAYAESFQHYDRDAFEKFLPAATALSETNGPLVHFAETHDNDRLASRGENWARMRTPLAALLSQQGSYGITAGVEWFAADKIAVHGAPSLNWDSPANQVDALARLNAIVASHPAFSAAATLSMIQGGPGNVLALLREPPPGEEGKILGLVNLDPNGPQTVFWPAGRFLNPTRSTAWDLLTGEQMELRTSPDGTRAVDLEPGRVRCLCADPTFITKLNKLLATPPATPPTVARLRRNALAIRVIRWLAPQTLWQQKSPPDPDSLGQALIADPFTFTANLMKGGADKSPPPLTQWKYPADLNRTLPVPPGHLILIRSNSPFRVMLEHNDQTLAAATSITFEGGWHGTLLQPPDTSRSTSHLHCTIKITAYTDHGAHRAENTLLVLTPGGAVLPQFSYSGVAVRHDPTLRALLTNGRGAMCATPAAWGEVHSQYDALLALNLDPAVPSDRLIFFTRCRAWLRYRGYSHAIDATCLDTFSLATDGSSARWHFHVPCGMGRWIPLAFTLTLERGRNRLLFDISRDTSNTVESDRRDAALPDDDHVTVILRPDIEWRSFHDTTRAWQGAEKSLPAACTTTTPDGFTFTPVTTSECTFRLPGATWNADPIWSYAVPHPEEADRGLAPHGDLFSPGWFRLPLRGGHSARLDVAHNDPPDTLPAPCPPPTRKKTTDPIRRALETALDAYIVTRDDALTVIAGYPWFLDWGRDTLIVLRGIIAAGRFAAAADLLRAFGRFEDNGTLPNMIRGNDASNRNTSDAPLWFCVAAADLAQATDIKTTLDLDCDGRTLADVIASILTTYCNGTPNGIHTDPGSGLVFSPAHYTWMDTNHPQGTPRQGYPVEIQALWIAALRFGAQHLSQRLPWAAALAAKASRSLTDLYWLPNRTTLIGASRATWLADSLAATPGTPAAKATPEDALRPNQLLAVTLNALTNRQQACALTRACANLIVPGGIRSLADRTVITPLPVWHNSTLLNDPQRPYWGTYTGDENTRRKPAYHNGTAWSWQFPLYAEALLQLYGKNASATAKALLGSASEVFNSGSVGQIPEILDGNTPHRQRGCHSQAWGISELLRVWLKC